MARRASPCDSISQDGLVGCHSLSALSCTSYGARATR